MIMQEAQIKAQQVIICIALALVVVLAVGLTVQTLRLNAAVAKAETIQTKYKTEKTIADAQYQAALDKAKGLEKAWAQRLITAEKRANEQKQIALAWRDRANAANLSLSATLDQAKTSLPIATKQANIEYTNALSDVFRECSSRHKELAAKADGHAVDAQEMSDAWPESTVVQ